MISAAMTAASLGGGLELRGLSKRFGRVTAIDGLDLQVRTAELFCLLGPSGSGKTTTLHAVAGFVMPDAGSVVLNGRDITQVPVSRRRLGVVFQDYALFPHMSALDNVAFGLRARGVGAADRAERARALLRLVGLEEAAERLPRQLSGGEQQRVAVARALAIGPDMLLLDEPLSNLDARLRVEVATELRRIQRETGITTLMVTHDQQEAFALADRLAVMNAGRVEQIGTPEEIYRHPVGHFVARFIGRANFIEGDVVEVGPTAIVRSRDQVFHARPRPGIARGDRVTIMIRPEAIRAGTQCAGTDCVHGELTAETYSGKDLTMFVRSADRLFELAVPANGPRHAPGKTLHLEWASDDAILISG